MKLEDLPTLTYDCDNYSKLGMSRSFVYQQRKLHGLSDAQIIMGYYDPSVYNCDAEHWSIFYDHLKTDKCIIMLNDHMNVRWLFEWIEEHRPYLLKRLNLLKAFI